MARDSLAELHANRDAARAQALARAERLRGEMTPEHLGKRVISDVKLRARDMAGEAVVIAGDNRGLLAGVVAAAAGWILRRQIARGGQAALAAWRARQSAPAEDE